MDRDIENEAVDVGEESKAQAAIDVGLDPSLEDKVVGNKLSTSDVDEAGASATRDTANLETTLADKAEALEETVSRLRRGISLDHYTSTT
jgi:hypothetical protein